MNLLTFGQVILLGSNHYIWLVLDEEEEKIHLAKILNVENTKDLIRVHETNVKKSKPTDAPLYAYVVLTTEGYDKCAAHLMGSGDHAESSDGLSVLGTLNEQDMKGLKTRILQGTGLPPRLVNLTKALG